MIDSCHGPGLDHGSRVMRVTGHKDPLLAYAIPLVLTPLCTSSTFRFYGVVTRSKISESVWPNIYIFYNIWFQSTEKYRGYMGTHIGPYCSCWPHAIADANEPCI